MRTASIAVLALVVTSCAHADHKVQPIVVTSHILDAVGLTFETVAAGMKAASARGALTAEQVTAWNDFTVRWAAGYGSAVEQWREAKKKLDQPAADQAAGLLTGLLSELGAFQIVLLGAAP